MNGILNVVSAEIVDYLLVGSVTAAILAPLAWGIARVCQIRAAVYRELLWLFCLVGTAALPVLWLYMPKLALEVLPAELTSPATGNTPVIAPVHSVAPKDHMSSPVEEAYQVTAHSAAVGGAPRQGLDVRVALTSVWLLGVGLLCVRLLVSQQRLRRLIRAAVPVDGDRRFSDLDLRKARILVSAQMDGPVCFGILRPIIVLPERVFLQGSAQECRMIVSHEMAHIERRDCWMILFQRLLVAIFFFHPLVWWASHQLSREREEICDNCVVACGASTDEYAALLARIAETGFAERQPTTLALLEGGLLHRIQRLFDPRASRRIAVPSAHKLVGTALLLACLVAFGSVRIAAESVAGQSLDTSGIGLAANRLQDIKAALAAQVDAIESLRMFYTISATFDQNHPDARTTGTAEKATLSKLLEWAYSGEKKRITVDAGIGRTILHAYDGEVTRSMPVSKNPEDTEFTRTAKVEMGQAHWFASGNPYVPVMAGSIMMLGKPLLHWLDQPGVTVERAEEDTIVVRGPVSDHAFQVWLDAARDMAPAKYVLEFSGGPSITVRYSEFREVRELPFEYPFRVDVRIRVPGAPARSQTGQTVIQALEVNTPLDDTLFSIDFPPGTHLRDAIQEIHYIVGDTEERASALERRAIANSTIGKPAPSLAGVRWIQSQPRERSDLQGRVVILLYNRILETSEIVMSKSEKGPYCPFPRVAADLYRDRAADGLTVVGILRDGTEEDAARTIVKTCNIEYPVAIDSGEVRAAYGVDVVDSSDAFLLDRDGIVVARGEFDKIFGEAFALLEADDNLSVSGEMKTVR